MANSVDPGQIPHTVTSDPGIHVHCLLIPICPNTWVTEVKVKVRAQVFKAWLAY